MNVFSVVPSRPLFCPKLVLLVSQVRPFLSQDRPFVVTYMPLFCPKSIPKVSPTCLLLSQVRPFFCHARVPYFKPFLEIYTNKMPIFA